MWGKSQETNNLNGSIDFSSMHRGEVRMDKGLNEWCGVMSSQSLKLCSWNGRLKSPKKATFSKWMKKNLYLCTTLLGRERVGLCCIPCRQTAVQRSQRLCLVPVHWGEAGLGSWGSLRSHLISCSRQYRAAVGFSGDMLLQIFMSYFWILTIFYKLPIFSKG